MRSKSIFLSLTGIILLCVQIFTSDIMARTVEFAGRTWVVKSGHGGPGPNYWSDSDQSVWVDGSDRLHLKIRKVGSTWYCAEVYTEGFTKYGMHRFYTIGWLDSLDKNVVFAPFLYKDDYNEVDIEFSKWGWDNPFNGWYVVQPGATPGNKESFAFSFNGTYSTHYMNWHSSWITFKSIHGHYQEPPNPDYLIHEWTYTGSDIPPQSENLRIHINLWLVGGNPPSDAQEVEVIIANADLPAPPTVTYTFKTSPNTNPPKVKVDGTWYNTDKSFEWEVGSTHEICAHTQTNNNTPPDTFKFNNWSNDGDSCHSITIESSNKILTAYFNKIEVEETMVRSPKAFSLLQNSPNPVYSATRISFGVPKETRIVIEIYNLSGKRVCTLKRGMIKEGWHTVIWNCKDNSEKKVAPGIYFYRMETDKFKATRKLTILR